MDYADQFLRQFITYVLTHPAVVRSPPSVQRTLRRELKVFILAHLTHAEDYARFHSEKSYGRSHDGICDAALLLLLWGTVHVGRPHQLPVFLPLPQLLDRQSW